MAVGGVVGAGVGAGASHLGLVNTGIPTAAAVGAAAGAIAFFTGSIICEDDQLAQLSEDAEKAAVKAAEAKAKAEAEKKKKSA